MGRAASMDSASAPAAAARAPTASSGSATSMPPRRESSSTMYTSRLSTCSTRAAKSWSPWSCRALARTRSKSSSAMPSWPSSRKASAATPRRFCCRVPSTATACRRNTTTACWKSVHARSERVAPRASDERYWTERWTIPLRGHRLYRAARIHGARHRRARRRRAHRQYRRLAAVVSNSPNVKYESSRRNMMAHTLVLEEVMEQFDLLPVRFGTIAPAAGSVEARLLAPRYQEFTELLEQMRGRIEVGLKAFWYEGAAVAEVVRENETIRRMRDALNGRSPTETYYERIRLGEEVEHALAQKRTRDEETILARIRPLVHKTRTNKIVSDRMVVNAAFLVDRQNGLQLDDAVRRLNDEFNDRLMFKYFGPVPPYNFVNIVVNWEG